MKANELRIGNYYIGASSGNIEVVTSPVIKAKEGKNLNIEPIPLTEEWLVRFGFQFIGSGDPSIKVNDDTRIVVPIKNTNINIYLEITQPNEYDEGQFCVIPTNNSYVHQLQNLYFALTGEELTIKN